MLDVFWMEMGGSLKDGPVWFKLKNKAIENKDQNLLIRSIRYKVMADVLEALIGAFYIHGGLNAAFAIIERMGIIPIGFLYEHTNESRIPWMRALQEIGEASIDFGDIPIGLKDYIFPNSIPK